MLDNRKLKGQDPEATGSQRIFWMHVRLMFLLEILICQYLVLIFSVSLQF